MRIIMAVALSGLLGIPALHAQEAPAAQGGSEVQTVPVDLNTATSTELQTLPGVGPALAMRIIEYRERMGGFERIEDVMNVRGVGEVSFLRIRGLITVSRESPDRASQGR